MITRIIKINSVIVITVLILVSLGFSFFILKNANWTWGDDFEFLISTAIGQIEWDFHIANNGRFNPFAHFDFNVLTLFPGCTTPIAHYSVVMISFLFYVYLSFYLYKIILSDIDKNQALISWIILVAILFTFYYFYRLFFLLVYPERMMIVLFTLFFILYSKFLKTNKSTYAIIAVLISLYLCLTKETSFVVFATMAGIGLLFNYKNNSKKENIFYLSLFVVIVVFLVLYYFIAYKTTTTLYTRHGTFSQVIKFTLGNAKILYIAILLFFWRFYEFVFKKDRENLMIDMMLVSGIMHAVANVVLRMPMDYFYYPAVMLTLPALVYWGVKLVRPEWVLVVLILSTGYYYRKFPKVMNSIQDMKTSTHKNLVEFTNILNDSDKAYWLQYDDIDEVVKGKMGYQREILEVYYHFYNNEDEAMEIKNINELPEELNSKIVLFYSDLQVSSEEYDITLSQIDSLGFTQQYLPNIQDIKIFTK